MTKHYVEIYYPGSFFPETTIKEVESRKPIEMPKGAYAFKFFDRTEVETTEGERLTGDRKNESGMYYAGEVFTLAQVKDKFPEADKLIFNMECNKWDKVIRTVRGNFQPFTETDVVWADTCS